MRRGKGAVLTGVDYGDPFWECKECYAGNLYINTLRAAQQAARRHVVATGHVVKVHSLRRQTYEKVT